MELVLRIALGAKYDYWNGGSKNDRGDKQYGTFRPLFLAVDNGVFPELSEPMHVSIGMDPNEYYRR